MINNKSLSEAVALAQTDIHDSLAAYIYTGDAGSLGHIKLAQLAQLARMGMGMGMG